MKFRIFFYRDKFGRCQACDYARRMDVHHQAKLKRWFLALAELGQALPIEYGKHLRSGIWELRIAIHHHQHRFLYSFWKDMIVVTSAFLKKTGKVPTAEIEKSRKAMADWISRKGWE